MKIKALAQSQWFYMALAIVLVNGSVPAHAFVRSDKARNAHKRPATTPKPRIKQLPIKRNTSDNADRGQNTATPAPEAKLPVLYKVASVNDVDGTAPLLTVVNSCPYEINVAIAFDGGGHWQLDGFWTLGAGVRSQLTRSGEQQLLVRSKGVIYYRAKRADGKAWIGGGTYKDWSDTLYGYIDNVKAKYGLEVGSLQPDGSYLVDLGCVE